MLGAVAIARLTLVNLAFIGLFAWGLIAGWNSVAEQQFEGFCLASALTTTAFILAIYRRWFLPDLLVVKKRRNKFEDL